MRTLEHLLPYLRRYRRKLILGLGCIALSVGVGLMAPLLVGRAVDNFRQEVKSVSLLVFAGLLVLVALVQGIFSYLQRMILVTTSRRIEFDLRNDYFAHLERLAPAFYERSYTGDLMARATNDLQAVRMLCGPAIMYSSNTLVTAIGALFLMFGIHARLTLLALGVMPLVAVATRFFGRRVHVLFERVQEQFSALSTRVQENLAGVRVIRAYAQEGAEKAAFAEQNREYVRRSQRLIRWSAAFHPFLQMLVGLGLVAVLWYGGRLVAQGRITVGEFVAFNLFLGKLTWPMIAIGWVINLVERGSASLGRIQEILDTPPTVVDEEPLLRLRRVAGSVRFRNLSFSYGEGAPRVLEEVDFGVEAGQTVAVVGRTGAGKSTLLGLIPRLWNPPPGTLFVDGADVRRLPVDELRSAIAMVPQETFLFAATVAENIAFGRPGASRREVAEAAGLAGLGEDLGEFPRDFDTLVGERGLSLSGGQKQRVALARALVRSSPILLLDDCLSAVDTQTEERILCHLEEALRGRTVFLVSHRLSAVQSADVILVLDRGRIVERGSHDVLMARGGLYAELHARQLLEEGLAAV